tara:strand:- start:492 stop:1538 length:1047 start_codon:yes stop_codon:yes gene_type:complete
MNLKESFLEYCKKESLEVNQNQLKIIDQLNSYYKENFEKSFFKKFFKKKNIKLGFYLVGDVGVGKTMLLNFFLSKLKVKKLRLHFNSFMIKFHDFSFQTENKDKTIDNFVRDLKNKVKILYFDEFQVTNIVDAMILGKLFKKIFEEKINVIFTSNINISELYKDGLQREQFLPFIKIMSENCYEKKLIINEDYRINQNIGPTRFLSPLNQSINFQFNKFFRVTTKNKKREKKILTIKGRKLILENFYSGILRINFNEIFNENLGSEDFTNIADNCRFIFLENIPDFKISNSNEQQRFITFIDIVYEKKIPLMVTCEVNIDAFNSSKDLSEIFKRTTSRLYELTSIKYN